MAIIKNSDIVLSSDIGSVLNAAGGSVNINQPATFFSADAKLNKWSKYKPVIHQDLFIDGDGRWKGGDLKCGLTITNYTYGDLAAAYLNDEGRWVYNIPNGTSSQPLRLGDFRGYSTDAKPFVTSSTAKGTMFKVNNINNSATSVTFTFAKNSDNYSLKVEDFDSSGYLKSAEVAALLYETDPIAAAKGGRYPVYRSLHRGDVIANTANPKVTIDTTSLPVGTYYALLCLGFMTNQYSYMTLPESNNNGYHLFAITVTKDAAVGQTFGFYRIGSTGTTSVSLTPISNYSVENSNATYYQLTSRGRMMFDIEVYCEEVYSISSSRQFEVSFETESGVNFTFPNMIVYGIDGAAATTGSLSKGSHTISLRTENDGQYLYPQDGTATKGQWTFKLIAANTAGAVPLATYTIYVNPVM